MQPAPSGNENLAAILQSLSDRGVIYELRDNVFKFCDQDGVLPMLEKIALDVIRPGLTKYLYRQHGLCIHCGAQPASRPNLDGYADRLGTPGAWTVKEAPQWLKEKYPPLWCCSCWNAGAWKE